MAKIEREGATPSTFVEIVGVKDFDMPKFKRDVVDITSHSSGGHGEQKPSAVLKPESFSFEIVYDGSDTVHTAIETDFYEGAASKHYKITPASGQVMTFSAYVVGFDKKEPMTGVETATVTLAITGAPTFA